MCRTTYITRRSLGPDPDDGHCDKPRPPVTRTLSPIFFLSRFATAPGTFRPPHPNFAQHPIYQIPRPSLLLSTVATTRKKLHTRTRDYVIAVERPFADGPRLFRETHTYARARARQPLNNASRATISNAATAVVEVFFYAFYLLFFFSFFF